MRENTFWNIVEEGIQQSIGRTPLRSGGRNNLFDIANAANNVQKAKSFLPEYLEKIDCPRAAMEFLILHGISFHA